jgi:hypothetical protein
VHQKKFPATLLGVSLLGFLPKQSKNKQSEATICVKSYLILLNCIQMDTLAKAFKK